MASVPIGCCLAVPASLGHRSKPSTTARNRIKSGIEPSGLDEANGAEETV